MSVSYCRLRSLGEGIYAVSERRVGFLGTLKERRVKVLKSKGLWVYADSKRPIVMPWLIDDLIVAEIVEKSLAELRRWKYGEKAEVNTGV